MSCIAVPILNSLEKDNKHGEVDFNNFNKEIHGMTGVSEVISHGVCVCVRVRVRVCVWMCVKIINLVM